MRVNSVSTSKFILLVAMLCLMVTLVPRVARGAVAEDVHAPRLMRVTPSRGGMVGRDAVVALSFDRPMDTESLKAAVSFSPPVEFHLSGEAECLVVPVNLLEGGWEYSFRLEPGTARDTRGGICPEEVNITFITRDDGMTLEVPALDFSGGIAEGEDPQRVVNVIGFGVGHYPGTGRPGGGNLVLMAHASGQVPFIFNRLQELKDGDELIVGYGGRTYTYRWKEGFVVPDTAMWILDLQPYPLLSFFVCCAEDGGPSPTLHPPYRYVVRAPLCVAELLGAP